jgi:hypothetical protein
MYINKIYLNQVAFAQSLAKAAARRSASPGSSSAINSELRSFHQHPIRIFAWATPKLKWKRIT